MNIAAKIGIIIVLAIAVAGILVMKNSTGDYPIPDSVTSTSTIPTPTPANLGSGPLPRLVDLGSGKCIPCKMMAPILEELKKEYQGKFKVEFLDVWQIQGIAEQYGIQVIPTQIFYDTTGKELFRHEGFYSKEDILNKWKELGIQL